MAQHQTLQVLQRVARGIDEMHFITRFLLQNELGTDWQYLPELDQQGIILQR